jgi:hypothetical protein
VPWITSAPNSAPRAAVKAVLTPLAVNHAQHHALYVDLCLAHRVSDLTLYQQPCLQPCVWSVTGLFQQIP